MLLKKIVFNQKLSTIRHPQKNCASKIMKGIVEIYQRYLYTYRFDDGGQFLPFAEFDHCSAVSIDRGVCHSKDILGASQIPC